MQLTVSFGGSHPSKITSVRRLEWADFAAKLSREPPESEDKASRGWYSCAEFDPVYRHGDNLVSRTALTFDYDSVSRQDVKNLGRVFSNFANVLYTTASHTAEKPRLRMVLPLSRPCDALEFQAVSRRVASHAGIELASRESHVPAQMMYLPTRKPGGKFKAQITEGELVLVDDWLAAYDDWRDRKSWPRRASGDEATSDVLPIPPDEKPGIVGEWCRAFSIEDCITRFNLPYDHVR